MDKLSINCGRKANARALLSILLLGMLFASISYGQTRADSLLRVFLDQPERILVASHRGNHVSHPENSLPAFEAAIQAGAGILELDVRQSKDGHLVVVHDRTVDRTTDGEGNVADMTLAELKSLRLLLDGRPSSLRIPTFREALEAVKDNILVDIDFKADTEEAAQACYRVIAELGMEKQVLFFLYDPEWVPHCFAMNPAIKVMPRAHDEETVYALMNEPRVRVIHIDGSFYTDALASRMRDRGVRVWANSLGDEDHAAMEKGGDFQGFFERMPLVNIVQTNYPKALADFLHTKNNPCSSQGQALQRDGLSTRHDQLSTKDATVLYKSR